jgi:ankyrin repeat protein
MRLRTKQLIQAALAGNVEETLSLLTSIPVEEKVEVINSWHEIDITTARGNHTTQLYTPLVAAAEKGHTKVMELLLNHGANPNFGEEGYYTSLTFAASKNQLEAVKILLRAGANPLTQNTHCTPLHAAAIEGSAELLRLIVTTVLEAGANIDIVGKAKMPPLYYAVTADPNPYEKIDILLRAGANINAFYTYTYDTTLSGAITQHITILSNAVERVDKYSLVKYLLDRGAQDLGDQALLKILHRGLRSDGECQRQCCKTTKLLLEKGANLENPLVKFSIVPTLVQTLIYSYEDDIPDALEALKASLNRGAAVDQQSAEWMFSILIEGWIHKTCGRTNKLSKPFYNSVINVYKAQLIIKALEEGECNWGKLSFKVEDKTTIAIDKGKLNIETSLSERAQEEVDKASSEADKAKIIAGHRMLYQNTELFTLFQEPLVAAQFKCAIARGLPIAQVTKFASVMIDVLREVEEVAYDESIAGKIPLLTALLSANKEIANELDVLDNIFLYGVPLDTESLQQLFSNQQSFTVHDASMPPEYLYDHPHLLEVYERKSNLREGPSLFPEKLTLFSAEERRAKLAEAKKSGDYQKKLVEYLTQPQYHAAVPAIELFINKADYATPENGRLLMQILKAVYKTNKWPLPEPEPEAPTSSTLAVLAAAAGSEDTATLSELNIPDDTAEAQYH